MRKVAALLAACLAALVMSAARAEPGITDTAEATYDKASGITTLTVRLAKNGAGFVLTTRWRAKPFDAVAMHQKLSGWKSNYFFVRDDCLAPDPANAPQRCALEHVFTLLDNGNRLAYLGAVFAGEDCIEEQKFGCSLYQDVLTDIFEPPLKHPTIFHAISPALLIELRAKDGALVADLEETWTRNQERYRAGARCIAAVENVAPTAGEKCAEGITYWQALLFNLLLTHYTRRDAAYNEILTERMSRRCAITSSRDCTPALQPYIEIGRLISAIVPGELPKPAGNVTAIKAAAKP